MPAKPMAGRVRFKKEFVKPHRNEFSTEAMFCLIGAATRPRSWNPVTTRPSVGCV
jgi:hypothetical protein